MRINYLKTIGFRKFEKEFKTNLYDITTITGGNTNKPGEDVDDSEEDPTKPGEDEEDSEDDTTKPGEDTDNSENVNKPEVDNNDNSSDLLSPETGDAGIFAMVSLIVVAGSVIYAINRKKSK